MSATNEKRCEHGMPVGTDEACPYCQEPISPASARCSAKPSCANRASQRNKLGGIYLEETHDSDNLAIALMCYFEHHMDNPQDGQEDEYGNNLWAARKVDAALERIAETIWPNESR